MYKRNYLLFLVLSAVLSITGCSSQTLKYRLDPDFGSLQEVAGQSKIVAVKVTDSRTTAQAQSNKTIISSTADEAKVLKDGLTKQLKELEYKIINNPLLADLAVTLDLKTLSLDLEASTFKSTLKAESSFTLTIRKNRQEWTKIFRSGRTQEVANPVNDNDATGVINQLLSKQLSSAFSDPALMEFLAKASQESDL